MYLMNLYWFNYSFIWKRKNEGHQVKWMQPLCMIILQCYKEWWILPRTSNSHCFSSSSFLTENVPSSDGSAISIHKRWKLSILSRRKCGSLWLNGISSFLIYQDILEWLHLGFLQNICIETSSPSITVFFFGLNSLNPVMNKDFVN